MHFASAKGEGHVNVCPPSYTFNKNQLYSWGTQWVKYADSEE